MATKLYSTETESNFVPDAYDAAWTSVAFQHKHLLTVTQGIGNYNGTYLQCSESSGAAQKILAYILISAELAAQTIGGTVSMAIRAAENGAAANCYGMVKITVRKPDGTIRGTLLNLTQDNVEFSDAGYKSRAVLSAVALSSVDVIAQDRLCIEVGMFFNNTKTTAYYGYNDWYNGATTDLPLNDAETARYNSWIEFSQTVAWYTSPADIIAYPPIVTVTMAPLIPIPRQPILTPIATATMMPLVPMYQAEGIFSIDLPGAILNLSGIVPTYDTHYRVIAIPAAAAELIAPIPIVDMDLTEIRQEINLLCHILSATSGNAATADETAELDKNWYPDGTFYFEVVGYTSASLAVDIALRRKGTSTDDAICSIPAGTTAPRVFRSPAFTPPTTAAEYVVYLPNTSGATKYVVSARIVILQKAMVLTKTENQYEVGNYETGKSNTAVAPLSYPKYWNQNWTVRDCAGMKYVEVVYKASGGSVTISLQEDDGSFANWADEVIIVSAGTASTPTRVRAGRSTEVTEGVFHPMPGRHYRVAAYCSAGTYDIYCAKVIYRQGEMGQRCLLGKNIYHVGAVSMSADGKNILVSCDQALDPDDNGAPEGTVYSRFSSSDYGDTWAPVHPSWTLEDLSSAISDDGKYRFTGDNYYLWTSQDFGLTWDYNPTEVGEQNQMRGLCCSSDGRYVYACNYSTQYGTESKLFKSSDYGSTWDVIDSHPMAGKIDEVRCDSTGQHVVWIWTGDGLGKVRYSSDYGETFNEAEPKPGEWGQRLIATRSLSTILFWWNNSSTYQSGWCKSVDYGATWSDLNISGGMYLITVADDGVTLYGWELAGNWPNYVGGLYKSENLGNSWTLIDAWTRDKGNARFRIGITSSSQDILLFAANEYRARVTVQRSNIKKVENQYLIENTYNDSMGPTDHDVKWEPTDWQVSRLVLKHCIDTSSDAGDSAKLQSDPNGTPADIADSTVAGANRVTSYPLTFPEGAATIDSSILNTPIYASKILVYYQKEPLIVPWVEMALVTHEPTIYPLKIPVPTAVAPLTTKTLAAVIPPTIYAYPPMVSMQLLTRSVNYYWGLSVEQAAEAAVFYRCILTGDGDSLSDIELPMSYFKAIMTDIDDSYISCVVPDVENYLDEINARRNGAIVIFVGYRLISGVELFEEIIRLGLSDVAIYRGGRHESITITGRGLIMTAAPKERVARDVILYTVLSDGRRKVLCAVDFFLRCGDTLIYGSGGAEYFFVGQIEFEAGAMPPVSKMCVTEL